MTSKHNCTANGICVDNYGGFTCNCTNGWTGQTCSDDINECYETPDICDSVVNSTCTNFNGSYDCTCHSGYARNSTTSTCESKINHKFVCASIGGSSLNSMVIHNIMLLYIATIIDKIVNQCI